MSVGIESPPSNGTRVTFPTCAELAGEELTSQKLVLVLEGITAGDYLTWVRDPEPPALGRELRSVTADAEPLGDRIDVELIWDREPPAAAAAASAAGFAAVSEVVAVPHEPAIA